MGTLKTHIIWLAILFLLGCQTNTKNVSTAKADSIEIVQNPGQAKLMDIRKCMPPDTIIKAKNSYVKYVPDDSVFDVEIGHGGWHKRLGYQFDCRAPRSIIPEYDWSSDEIIALQRGCGNPCRMSIYYPINTDSSFERMDVLAFDAKCNLIAYYEWPVFIIEDIAIQRKIKYSLTDTPACASSWLCFENTHFSGLYVYTKMHIVKNDSEKTVSKSFLIPKKLLR